LLLTVGARIASAETAPSPSLEATVSYETGPAYIVQNDGRYGVTGTRYDADTVGQRDNLLVIKRTSIELAHGRHRAILLYAPFEASTKVTLARDLQFRDTLFVAGTPVEHRYLFDGFRASYLYRLVARGPVELEVGGSLQIRNAEVAFLSLDGAQRAAENDIGVVFAAKTRLWYRPAPDAWWAAFDADAFSTFGLVPGVRGAIYDVQLAAGHPVASGVDLVFGARLLGGGAKVEDRHIYNWANFVALTAGVRVSLERL
ncbi:MAG TPA: hypothetical protein VLT45_27680, partial [Kofleriaceae bacterium]|nr:hypothetical protein [Kofleriaceae bacterium]